MIRESRSNEILGAIAAGLASAFVGRQFSQVLRQMKRAQWLPGHELQRRAEARLLPLLRHAMANVPFYRDYCDHNGISPSELRGVADLQQFPVLAKADYRQRSLGFFVAMNVPEHRRLLSTTSGSTGEPFKFFLDRDAMPLVLATQFYVDETIGLYPFNRLVRIAVPSSWSVWPAAPRKAPLSARIRYKLRSALQSAHERRTLQFSTFQIDPDSIIDIYRQIDAFRPRFVMGYSSSLATLSDELLKRNLHLSHRAQGVITTAENLTPDRRRLISEYFQAPITNRYGLREFGFWSRQNCEAWPEGFHINTELVLPEVLRDDGSPAAPGESGQLVLTHLSNYAMPFIRYATGDRAALAARPCACGRGFPLIERLEGRLGECLRTPSGKILDPTSVANFLRDSHGFVDAVRHYQLIHEAPNRARLRIVPSTSWSEAVRADLTRNLGQLLGPDIDLVVESLAEIPLERSGKRPIIKIAFDRPS